MKCSHIPSLFLALIFCACASAPSSKSRVKRASAASTQQTHHTNYHTVRAGETLYRIGLKYRVSAKKIAQINHIKDPTRLKIAQRLRIPRRTSKEKGNVPHRVRPAPKTQAKSPKKAGQQKPRAPWLWPTQGIVTSKFGRRAGRAHDGIDIGAKAGSKVIAVDAAQVVFSGRQGGYGNLIVLRHPSGLVTVYAHNQKNLVKEGDKVRRGQMIAKIGSTGRASGPHLHFEVRSGLTPRNPLKFLPLDNPKS